MWAGWTHNRRPCSQRGDPLRNLTVGALDMMGVGAIASDLQDVAHGPSPMRLARDTWPWRLAPLARLAWGGATGSQ